MRPDKTHLALAAALWLLASLPASANDGSFGGSGASLAPLASTPIRMAREDIAMELTGRPLAWSVTALYWFENPTDREVSVQMGYPETRCDPEEGDCSGQGGQFRGLSTRVRGRRVRHRVGRVSAESPWAMELDRVHLFDVTFAPRERVRVEHRYTYDRSFTAVLGENVHYLTRTGALWSGPIGEARFTVRTPDPPWRVDHPRVFPLVSWDRVVQNGRGLTELVFEVRDLRPTVDFDLLLAPAARLQAGEPIGDGSVDVSECPAGLGRTASSGEERRAAQQWLREATRDELAACRNLAFALSGYTFRNARWARAFYGAGDARAAAAGEGFVVAAMRPARSFTAAQMPVSHGAWVRRFNAELARRPAPANGQGDDLD